MDALTAGELDPDLMLFVLAVRRLEWGYAQLGEGEDDPGGKHRSSIRTSVKCSTKLAPICTTSQRPEA